MTSYAKREVTTRRVEYAVEANANVGVLYRVLAIAYQDYLGRVGKESGFNEDGWAEIIPRDEETVVAFLVEYVASKADREIERLADLAHAQTGRMQAVLDLVDRADREGWEAVLRESGDDIPQAIRRILKP